MKFVIFRMADERTEASGLPTEEEIQRMSDYNEEMLEAGVLLGGDGLRPSSHGARVSQSGAERTVTDGPFAEAKELIAGYTMIEVGSKEEALEWVRRWPEPDVELHVRQVIEMEDFGEAATPEVVEQNEQLRARVESQRQR